MLDKGNKRREVKSNSKHKKLIMNNAWCIVCVTEKNKWISCKGQTRETIIINVTNKNKFLKEDKDTKF
jgi:hypothetical protein